MRKEDRTEIEKLYQQLGIQNVDKVNTKLSTCRVTGHFSTKVTVSKGFEIGNSTHTDS